jgi:hypothetical protein
VSPLATDTYSEYQDSEFLERVGLGGLSPRLREFWPRGGPCWDALAKIKGGCVLVEAKSHVPEIYGGGCGASAESRQKIQAALDATKTWLGVSPDANAVDEGALESRNRVRQSRAWACSLGALQFVGLSVSAVCRNAVRTKDVVLVDWLLGMVSGLGGTMSNGLKFREEPQRSKTTNEGDVRPLRLMFGEHLEQEQLHERVRQLQYETTQVLNPLEEMVDRSGKANSGRTSGLKGKKRKASRTQRTKSGVDQRRPPPGQGHRRVGGGREDDFDRVVAMLESIRKTLERLVIVAPRVVPQELYPSIRQSWHQADEGFKTAIATLRDKTQRVRLNQKLEAAGFSGEMLDMKETSLSYHMARVDKAILSYDNKETMLEKLVRWIKPGFNVMNSVLGSLSTIPGVEVGKEFKEHLESAYEVVETGQAA